MWVLFSRGVKFDDESNIAKITPKQKNSMFTVKKADVAGSIYSEKIPKDYLLHLDLYINKQ